MRKKKGFTLLELMIVVIIIGLLAIIAIPQYFQAVKKTKENKAKANLNEIRKIEMASDAASGAWIGLASAPDCSSEVCIQVDIDNDDSPDMSLSFTDATYDYTLSGDIVSTVNADLLDNFQIDLSTGELTTIP
jgi:prepilin-type N-terminal cleavage/methylation domain-containing protein